MTNSEQDCDHPQDLLALYREGRETKLMCRRCKRILWPLILAEPPLNIIARLERERDAAVKALEHIPDDIDFLMEVIRGLEALAGIHGYKADADGILRGAEIRARSREIHEVLANLRKAP